MSSLAGSFGPATLDGSGAVAGSSMVWSVGALVQAVVDALAARFQACSVRGEISGFSRAASGHCYFNLKDADGGTALLRCAMFRRSAGLLDFSPADGQIVQVRGRLGLYEARGELQLIVEAMQRGGAGALFEQFLRLKARLEAEGLFDPLRKRALPPYPARIGVVTSLAAAALRDLATTLARRAPHVEVIVYPSPVQGAEAPAALAAAIGLAGQRAEVDTLLVCRGGGSLEDLWAFNDERVVRAIAAAPMPVVCGVGHETDVTLADFAADLRAPTPTAAAELAAPATQRCIDTLGTVAVLLRRRMQDAQDAQAQRLDRSALRLARPADAMRRHAQQLELLSHRLGSAVQRSIQTEDARHAVLDARWRLASDVILTTQSRRLASAAARLAALDPTRVLERGYAWLTDETGQPVQSVSRLAIGMPLQARLHDGLADVAVTRVEPSMSG